MFIFKEGSRNAFNNDSKEGYFKENYQKIFKRRLPHMDTVNDFLKVLDDDQLEIIKSSLISALIEKRVFHKFKFLDRSFIVAVDATVVSTYDKQYSRECLSRSSKNGVTTYLHIVLEAKLVTSSGLSISLATEWLTNDQQTESFKKQDCEQAAFKRLAVKIKKFFPRLPICILADSLYPHKSFMEICKQMNWNYIVNLKDGCLKALQRTVSVRYLVSGRLDERADNKNEKITRTYRWFNDLQHLSYSLGWVECVETIENIKSGKITTRRFVHITNLDVNILNVKHISQTGRQRWKIENEGFNIQKNNGYGLGHKYSRSSFQAFKNYYQCMQIAHMINQLAEASTTIKELLYENKKSTIRHLQKLVTALMSLLPLDNADFDIIDQTVYKIKIT